jgi:hypothetical protein
LCVRTGYYLPGLAIELKWVPAQSQPLVWEMGTRRKNPGVRLMARRRNVNIKEHAPSNALLRLPKLVVAVNWVPAQLQSPVRVRVPAVKIPVPGLWLSKIQHE